MIVSVIAIVIASTSLLWNIVSTLYSWHIAKPAIKLEKNYQGRSLSTQTGKKNTAWLKIALSNTGRSAISVTSFYIWLEYNFFGIGIESDGNRDDAGDTILGPSLPYTLEPNHSAAWNWDLVYLFSGYGILDTKGTGFLIEITLGNGKKIQSKVAGDEFKRYQDLVDRSYPQPE
jgi:hypothetical protein